MGIAVAGLLTVGIAKDTTTYDSHGWYAAAVGLFAFAFVIWLVVDVAMPVGVHMWSWAGTGKPPGRSKGSKLEIVNAVYGPPGSEIDVTGTIDRLVNDNRATFVVDGSAGLNDIAPGVVKTLTVKFRYDGREQTKRAQDGATVNLP
jgi:hypothetical protein